MPTLPTKYQSHCVCSCDLCYYNYKGYLGNDESHFPVEQNAGTVVGNGDTAAT